MKTSILARLVALTASAAVTFSIVALLAGYGLPQDSGTELFAASSITSAE